MEDNLHEKLIESEEFYGDYEMPHDALEKFRQYESKKIQPPKIGFYKYLSAFMVLAFIISNAYWINNSMKTDEKITIDTNRSSSNISDQEKQSSSSLLKEYSSLKSTKEETKEETEESFKKSPINNTKDSQQDLTVRKNNLDKISDSDNHNKDSENQIKYSPSPKIINKYDESVASHSTLTAENTVSSLTSKEDIVSGTSTNETLNSKNSLQSNVQIKDLLIEEAPNEKLKLSKLMTLQIESISSIEKQKPLSSLPVQPFQKTIPNKPKLNHRFSLGLNYSWIGQAAKKYPSLSGHRLGIKGGMAITDRLHSRINFSVLHQDGNIKDINDVTSYGLTELELPAGATFEKLNFDRFAIGATLGLDYYFNNYKNIRPFIGGHYHLEASHIKDINNFYQSASSETVKTILPNGKARINNYVGLMTGVEMAVWRNFSISLELQFFKSLSKRENSFHSIGIGTYYKF